MLFKTEAPYSYNITNNITLVIKSRSAKIKSSVFFFLSLPFPMLMRGALGSIKKSEKPL